MVALVQCHDILKVMDQEGENDHLMKTVMRALNSAQEKVLPITQVRALFLFVVSIFV